MVANDAIGLAGNLVIDKLNLDKGTNYNKKNLAKIADRETSPFLKKRYVSPLPMFKDIKGELENMMGKSIIDKSNQNNLSNYINTDLKNHNSVRDM